MPIDPIDAYWHEAGDIWTCIALSSAQELAESVIAMLGEYEFVI